MDLLKKVFYVEWPKSGILNGLQPEEESDTLQILILAMIAFLGTYYEVNALEYRINQMLCWIWTTITQLPAEIRILPQFGPWGP